MSIIGLNIKKMLVEKNEAAKGKISVNNNIKITEVKDVEFSLGKSDQAALGFGFEFTCKYEPKVGEILIAGDVVVLDDKKNTEKILKDWKKNKKVDRDARNKVIINILNKCNIQALILSRDVNLPPPIPMPKLSKK